MDDIAFDRLTKVLGATSNRRNALGLAAVAAFGGFAGLLGLGDTDARKKKKKGCPKKPCPRGFRRNKRTCKCECLRQPCSGGKEFDADACRCACPAGLRECKDGCVGLDECCPEDPPCAEDEKGCCHNDILEVCTIDGCCLEFDGQKACDNFCIDTNTDRNHCGDCNTPCGSDQTCVNGNCRPADQCPNNGVLCPGNSGPFCAPAGHSCCGDNDCNSFNECCDPAEGTCCLKGRCVERRCCPGNREVCAGKCCPVGQICCGSKCCSANSCADGACCAHGACGAVGADDRVCRGENESCCERGPEQNGYACPADAPLCAPGGACCPLDKPYSQGCQRCCPSLVLCDSGRCVDPIAGRS